MYCMLQQQHRVNRKLADKNIASFSIDVNLSINIKGYTDMYHCWYEYATKQIVLATLMLGLLLLNMKSNVGSSISLNNTCSIDMNTEY